MKKNNPAYIAVLGIVIMCILGYPSCWSLFSRTLVYDYHWTEAAASLPTSAYSVGYAVGILTVGALQKKYSPAMLGTISGLLLLCGHLVSGLTLSYPVILVGYGVLGGLGVAGLYSVAISVPPQYFSEKTANRLTGFIVAAFGLAPVVYSPVLSAAIGNAGPRGGFFTLAVLAGGIGTLTATRLKAPTAASPDMQTEDTKNGNAGASELSMKIILRDPAVLCMSLWFFTHGYAAFVLMGHLANIVYRQGGIENAAFLISLYGICNCTVRMVSGFLNTQKMMYIYFPIVALNAVLLSRYTTIPCFLAAVVITAVGFGMPAVAIPACIRRIYKPEDFSMVYGFVALFSGIGVAVGSYAAGKCVDMTGSYRWAFLASAVLNILVLLTTRIVFRRMHDQR